MMRREIVTERIAVEMMENCSCDGWDVVTSLRKYKKNTEKNGSCLCGGVRGFRMSDGRWTMVVDAPRILSVVPKAEPEAE